MTVNFFEVEQKAFEKLKKYKKLNRRNILNHKFSFAIKENLKNYS